MFFNQIKTLILLSFLSGIFIFLGYFVGGGDGIFMALILATVMNFVSYFWSDKIVLAMYGAKPLDRNRFEYIYEIIDELCNTMRMPKPKLWYIESDMANAFATGRNPTNASVAVTSGILELLDKHELRGVLAHEISHVANRDILIGTVAAVIASAIGYLAYMLRWAAFWGSGSRDGKNRDNGLAVFVLAIFVPIIATLIQLAISRSREYLADETGAKCCKDPLSLASALEKLEHGAKDYNCEPESAMEASIASLFIVYPFSGKNLLNLLSTHPPMADRISRLRKMARHNN